MRPVSSSSHSVPHGCTYAVFTDPVQTCSPSNNSHILNTVTDGHLHSGNYWRFYVDLGTLDSDGVHSQAVCPIFFVSGLPGYEEFGYIPHGLKLKGLGRHITLRRTLTADSGAGDATDYHVCCKFGAR
jgi:hypothetical protein